MLCSVIDSRYCFLLSLFKTIFYFVLFYIYIYILCVYILYIYFTVHISHLEIIKLNRSVFTDYT